MKYQHHFYGPIQGVSQTFGVRYFHALVIKVSLKLRVTILAKCIYLPPLLCLTFFPIHLICVMVSVYVTLIAQVLGVALLVELEGLLF
jgi:hypothetical protein